MAGAIVVQDTRGAPAGSVVSLAGIQVYDKAGVWLGAISTFGTQSPPSRGINFLGSFSFHMPRMLVDPVGGLYPNPDLYLIPDGVIRKGDRLVVYGDNLQPNEPWAGVITDVEWTDGSCIVQCTDIFDLLTTPHLPEDNEIRGTRALTVANGSLASTVAQVVITEANTWFGANGEVLWGLDASGSYTFFGDESITGDPASAIDMLVTRSFGEYICRVELTASTMRPVLVWRDQFLGAAGCDLYDGEGGNIVATPSLSSSPTTVVNAVRVTGNVTVIESPIPEGATAQPYQQVVPVAEVWLDPQGYRRRLDVGQSGGVIMNVAVPFTVDADVQDALNAAEEAKMRGLFAGFIHAYHMQYGMPWHGDDYSWDGSYDVEGEDFQRVLTVDRFLHFGALGSGPSHIVMKGHGAADAGIYANVLFDRVENVRLLRRNGSAQFVPPETVFDFEWRLFEQGQYDPYVDGIGEQSPYTTIHNGAETSDSWQIVPYGIGDKTGSASLLHGCTATQDWISVSSVNPFPSTMPFVVTVDGDEDMLVTSKSINILYVVRGFNGTVPSIHEVNAAVVYNVAASEEEEAEPTEIPPIEVPFPDGEAYGARLLEKLNLPRRLFTVHMANVGNDVQTVGIGTSHSLNIATEGPPEGIVATVRCVGFAPSWFEEAPSMELLLQEM
jgi:hypothetical protein